MSKGKVLVVESDEDYHEWFKHYLSQTEFDFEIESDSDAALRQIRDFEPHLVVVDIDSFSWDTLDKFHELIDAFIYLSSDNSREAIRTALERGIYDYLSRPFQIEELLGRIHSAMNHIEQTQIT